MECMTRSARMAIAVIVTSLTGAFAAADSEFRGRISVAEESGLIKGQEDTDWSYASTNSIVMPGDTIWADDNSAMEIEFSGGTFLRLADGSRLDVMDVPPNGLFRGDLGSFYVQRISRSNGDVIFDTPVGSVSIEPDTQVRIDILEGGATTVTVRWGRAMVHSPDGDPVPVNAGDRTYIDPGYLPSAPISFDRGEEDAFDSWNRDRARYLAQGAAPTPIAASSPGGSEPLGVRELNTYGEWIYIDKTPYWRPTVVVNYVPYRYGYWSYAPRHGYIWCDNYAFGYTTSHYGYWRYHSSYGWCWSYAGYYRPAYAYTVSYGDYFVWAPLGYDGYPVRYGAYAGFDIGNVHFSFGFSSYAYRYDVLHCRPNVFVVEHHHIYDYRGRHRYRDANYWRIEADPRPYQGAGRPHWPGGSVRTYQPEQVYRGVVNASDTGGRQPRERARELEARRSEPVVRQASTPQRTLRATPTAPATRHAEVRNARVGNAPSGRVARTPNADTRTSPTTRSRTYSNENARDAAPLGRGSVGDRPSAPSDRRVSDTATRSRTNDTSRTDAPSTPRRTTGTDNAERRDAVQRPSANKPATERPQAQTTRPATPQRPSIQRPSTSSPSRPEAARPEISARPIERPSPQTTRTQVGEPSRPEAVRPSRPSTTVTRPEPPATTRPQISRPRVSQPQVSQPRVSQPQTSRQPSVTRTTPSRPTAPSYTAPSRPTAPQAPSRANASPSPRASQPQYSPPAQAPAPRASSPSYSAPSPRSSNPRVSSPPSSSSRSDSGSASSSRSSSSDRGVPRGGRSND